MLVFVIKGHFQYIYTIVCDQKHFVDRLCVYSLRIYMRFERQPKSVFGNSNLKLTNLNMLTKNRIMILVVRTSPKYFSTLKSFLAMLLMNFLGHFSATKDDFKVL